MKFLRVAMIFKLFRLAVMVNLEGRYWHIAQILLSFTINTSKFVLIVASIHHLRRISYFKV